MIQAVVTTGIYCLPTCSARPKPENVRHFPTTAAARAAGFRACKRCRPDGDHLVRLDYRAPMDAEGLVAFLGRRAVPGVEEVVDGAYRRSLRLPHGAGVAELRPADGHLEGRFWLDDRRDLDVAVQRCRVLLDLDAEPDRVSGALEPDELIGPLVRAAPGRRVPGHVDGAELAIRAVLGQQVSLAGAATLAGRLVAEHGDELRRPLGAVTHLFPSAQRLAAADPDRMAMPSARARALIGLAEALARREIVLDAGADRDEAERRLLALPGIGPWTASYIRMRGLRDPDAFLPTDLGVQHALELLGQDGRPAAAERLAERWRPFRAYAMQHLWAQLSAVA